MKNLGGCRVYSPEDGRISVEGTWSARSVVSRETGAERITQTVSEYSAGVSPGVVNRNAEEVLYVAAGAGAANVDGFAYPLRAGCALFVPPGAVYTIENFGPETFAW